MSSVEFKGGAVTVIDVGDQVGVSIHPTRTECLTGGLTAWLNLGEVEQLRQHITKAIEENLLKEKEQTNDN